MFGLFKKKEQTIYAPISGTLHTLEEVPDPVFSQRMMGEGVAIQPIEGRVVAPFDGEIVNVASTKHAVGLRNKEGLELLIHVGLETVTLKGEGFEVYVNAGEQVKAGQLLLMFDLASIASKAKALISPVVITNQAEIQKELTISEEREVTAGETVLITVTD